MNKPKTMFKKLLFALLVTTTFTHAQHSVSGNLQPAENYPYMILYQLQGAKQNYIAYDSIKKGAFSIAIPKGKASGIYRLVYDIKNKLFVDFIYDNENVSLTLNPRKPNQSIVFTVSENNKIYQNYLKMTLPFQGKIDSLQIAYFSSDNVTQSKKTSKLYQTNKLLLDKNQQAFERKSTGKFVANFIKASASYNADAPIKLPADYSKNVQLHFFDAINFSNTALLNSSFINDKINNFIFYLNTSDDKSQLTKLRKEAITIVIDKIGSDYNLAKDIEEGLLYNFARQENITMVNYMLNYYLRLPKELQDIQFINGIKDQLKIAIGNIAPNILWTENNTSQSLHKLDGASHYVIVFWSSTCGHCLKELPSLYNFTKDKKDIKIIAIGLETNESKVDWQIEIAKYQDWIHVFGENKWKNRFARDYGVNATPSFYILDAKKKILAKPDDVKELKMFFEKSSKK